MRCLFIFILYLSNVGSRALMELSVKTGGSVTIPCRYDRKYIQHKKYWCSGTTFSYCNIEAFTNETRGEVTVIDHPAENLFTVTMNNLQTENTGWYWCAVEIARGSDVKEDLYITVKSDPDLSVMESRVSAEEGGSVTVQCLYSAAYQKKQKQWCRFKDRSCYEVGTTPTSPNSAVQIRDDGKRSFSVQMSGLKKSDTGWYWCSAGDLQVPVHIAVKNSTVSPNVTKNTNQQNGTSLNERSLWILSAVGLVLLIILISVVAYMLNKMRRKENQNRTQEKSNDAAVHTPPSALDFDVTYTTVVSAEKNQTHSFTVKDDDVTYSNMGSLTVKDNDATYGNVRSPRIRDDAVVYSMVIQE
ncbi:transmembrane domain-containing protein TMIGD3-like [Neoarius graeffei]|uniref:transmembrane domain-containing protein TMIGD3-like n=1 Tax=Neoarius graeffei TaxID=443677 RepID=UPI00298CD26C|nr:transmembrane domain-containing protein TMIGD3-like [Neoarius graeffei]XP_060762354.1 transmembrane domain-containing protein TMIGD3-like [Neoarius graeffei]